MTSDPSAHAGSRGFLIGLAAGAVVLLLVAFTQAPAPEPQHTTSDRAPSPIEQWQPAPPPEGDEASVTQAASREPPQPSRATAPRPAPSQEAAAPSFKFLGKVTDRGATSVVLHASGRTLTVRGTGPVDDDYVADTFQANYLILRHVRSGTSHLIEFTQAPLPTAAAWTGGETPQD